MEEVEKSNDRSTKKPLFQLKVKKKRRRREEQSDIAEHFDADEKQLPDDGDALPVRTEPLVIPSEGNKLKWNKPTTTVKEEEITPSSAEDSEAARALQEQASGGGDTTTTSTYSRNNSNPNRVIESNANTFVNTETQQYKNDLEALPDSLSETADAYEKVPIAEFGAALLRGMGWKEDDDDNGSNKKKKESSSSNALPRPHRLGLGAIPKAQPPLDESSSSSRRSKRPDQFQRDKAVRSQQEAYAKEREQKLALDKQRTLQNESLVLLRDDDNVNNRRRGRILKLVGVPGLNMVSVQFEGDSESTIVKRSAIDRLLTRQELEDEPFKEPEQQSSNNRDRNDKSGDRRRRDRDTDDRKRIKKDDDDDDKRRRDRKKDDRKKRRRQGDNDHRKSRSSKDDSWIIPNIRVRVITEKLGRRHYKQKGVVVDVTIAGATLQMPNNVVLEHVPERYLETALPKVGGNAVVLTGEHKFAKGQLLERNSAKGVGVLQIFEDMNVLTLSLDDMAEWCGPLDDALG